MHTYTIPTWGKVSLLVVAGAVIASGLTAWHSVAAAGPIAVTYHGPRVTTAVPGKPFTIGFKVKNTSLNSYSNTTVTFHIPSGMTHSRVAPDGADIQDDIVQWQNVPMASGQALYPTFTFTLDSGTPLTTKQNIWVEVTGNDGMEATSTNFSITAVSATKATQSAALSSSEVQRIFASVYGYAPSSKELSYWLGRRSDKPKWGQILGAMQFHKLFGISHK